VLGTCVDGAGDTVGSTAAPTDTESRETAGNLLERSKEERCAVEEAGIAPSRDSKKFPS
jgi:hypothetical protein